MLLYRFLFIVMIACITQPYGMDNEKSAGGLKRAKTNQNVQHIEDSAENTTELLPNVNEGTKSSETDCSVSFVDEQIASYLFPTDKHPFVDEGDEIDSCRNDLIKKYTTCNFLYQAHFLDEIVNPYINVDYKDRLREVFVSSHITTKDKIFL